MVRATETDVALGNVDVAWVVAVVGGDDDDEDVDGDEFEQFVDDSEPVAVGPILVDGTVAGDNTHPSEAVVAFVALASRLSRCRMAPPQSLKNRSNSPCEFVLESH